MTEWHSGSPGSTLASQRRALVWGVKPQDSAWPGLDAWWEAFDQGGCADVERHRFAGSGLVLELPACQGEEKAGWESVRPDSGPASLVDLSQQGQGNLFTAPYGLPSVCFFRFRLNQRLGLEFA